MRLIRLQVGVKARVGCVPQVTGAGRVNSIPRFQLGLRAGLAEITIEVLFASQVRAPGGVWPMAQLLIDPNTSRPVGSALVRRRGSPAAGPPMALVDC